VAARCVVIAVCILAGAAACAHAQQGASPGSQSDAVGNASSPQSQLNELETALKHAEQAQDARSAATILNQMAAVYSGMGDQQSALHYYQQAQILKHLLGDKAGEALSLNNIGTTWFGMGDKQKALDAYNQALTLCGDSCDDSFRATLLNNAAMTCEALQEKEKALDFYNQLLVIARRQSNDKQKIRTLVKLADLYDGLDDHKKTIEDYTELAATYHSLNDQDDQSRALYNIGVQHVLLQELGAALSFFQQALAGYRTASDQKGTAETLTSIGNTYGLLNSPQNALSSYTDAASLYHQLGNATDEALTVYDIGNAYIGLKQYEKALESLTHALALGQGKGFEAFRATVLNDIGTVYESLGNEQKALESYQQSMTLGSDEGAAFTVVALCNIGDVQEELGERQKALDSHYRALPIAAGSGDPTLLAEVYWGLMKDDSVPEPSLAIFFGKQAVNMVQKVRGNLSNLDPVLQKSFLALYEEMYRKLAEILISEGRLSEAEKVLDLLKEQEYNDYVRGESTADWGQLALTAREQQARTMLDFVHDETHSLVTQFAQLRDKPSRTAEEDARLKQLDDDGTAAIGRELAAYQELDTLFHKPDATTSPTTSTQDTNALEELVKSAPGTVGVYTLEENDRLREIVITGSGTETPLEYSIAQKDLNRKVEALRQALNDPTQDPLPPAQALYKVVVGPIADLLGKSGAHTVLWSLDGVLRYVPVAALHDGKQYMVENYANVVISTRQAQGGNARPDFAQLRGVGFGLYNQKYSSEPSLAPLPNVLDELFAIIRDQQLKDSKGVVPGTIVMDDDFTETALEEQLRKKPPIVHIASHFVFRAGDDRGSFLLLAGEKEGGLGYELSLAELNQNKDLDFTGTELLTLSACETGLGAEQDGHEVDGLGTMAQRKGAQAVIASLWRVDDASTADLMGDFYTRWVSGAGKLDKAEALREAQVQLLEEKIVPAPDPQNPDAAKSFAHPHYWAPFILMGNWR